jgi:hypothetical protein
MKLDNLKTRFKQHLTQEPTTLPVEYSPEHTDSTDRKVVIEEGVKFQSKMVDINIETFLADKGYSKGTEQYRKMKAWLETLEPNELHDVVYN